MDITRIKNVLEENGQGKLFSGASLATYRVGFENKIVNYGYTSCCSGYAITNNTYYDLASLTKPLVTVLSLLMVCYDGSVKLSTRIGSFYPELTGALAELEIGDLLLHRSGLPAHFPFYEENLCEKTAILKKIFSFPLTKKHVYSDLGFMVLGDIIERLSGLSLPQFWLNRVAVPLGVAKDFCFAGDERLRVNNCALTSSLIDKESELCGIVHDDNARILGGYAGHAGLFGNINGMLKLCINILALFQQDSENFVSSSFFRMFLQSRGKNWRGGFDTPSTLFSSSGKFFSRDTIGHLGFTGTSFWIDLEKKVVVVLLTNRALYRDNLRKMKKFRPYIHDMVMEEMGYGKC